MVLISFRCLQPSHRSHTQLSDTVMPYYSVHISGGKDQDTAGREARAMFNGIEADYTGTDNFFYVHKPYLKAQLEENLSAFRADGYDVFVKKISKTEYYWRRSQ